MTKKGEKLPSMHRDNNLLSLFFRAVWFDEKSYPQSWELNPTEGPCRVRKRCQRGHLGIAARFLKKEAQYKLGMYHIYPKIVGSHGFREDFFKFSHYKSMGAKCCHGNQSSNPICQKIVSPPGRVGRHIVFIPGRSRRDIVLASFVRPSIPSVRPSVRNHISVPIGQI